MSLSLYSHTYDLRHATYDCDIFAVNVFPFTVHTLVTCDMQPHIPKKKVNKLWCYVKCSLKIKSDTLIFINTCMLLLHLLNNCVIAKQPNISVNSKYGNISAQLIVNY